MTHPQRTCGTCRMVQQPLIAATACLPGAEMRQSRPGSARTRKRDEAVNTLSELGPDQRGTIRAACSYLTLRAGRGHADHAPRSGPAPRTARDGADLLQTEPDSGRRGVVDLAPLAVAARRELLPPRRVWAVGLRMVLRGVDHVIRGYRQAGQLGAVRPRAFDPIVMGAQRRARVAAQRIGRVGAQPGRRPHLPSAGSSTPAGA